jgi:uncharacterized protein
MTTELIHDLMEKGIFPEGSGKTKLVETHISWVILCDHFVYKIKKPIQYSFLDFSTVDKRKYYCEKEVELNRRLTENIYLGTEPVRQNMQHFSIGRAHGNVIDYAVKMRRIDRSRQMDVLLQNNEVTQLDIQHLAKKIAAFHINAIRVFEKNLQDIPDKFNDLGNEKNYLQQQINADSGRIISDAISIAGAFMKKHHALLAQRLREGFVRDGHGDLHCRNIFLLPDPQPFDCLEFNDDYRQIDVLNDIAFMCMDLDAFGRSDLAELFLQTYLRFFSCIRNNEEQQLFIYYKSYRANIRAKVNSLRARTASTDEEKRLALSETGKYLRLMDHYISILRIKVG